MRSRLTSWPVVSVGVLLALVIGSGIAGGPEYEMWRGAVVKFGPSKRPSKRDEAYKKEFSEESAKLRVIFDRAQAIRDEIDAVRDEQRALGSHTIPKTDKEWGTFRRETVNAFSLLMVHNNTVEASQLYRQIELNPADTYIAVVRRPELVKMINAYRPLFQKLTQLEKWVSAKELNLWIKLGLARLVYDGTSHAKTGHSETRPEAGREKANIAEAQPKMRLVPWSDSRSSESSVETAADGRVVVYLRKGEDTSGWRDGKFYVATSAGMRMLVNVRSSDRQLKLEMAVSVLWWFADMGCCSYDVARALFSKMRYQR